MQIWVRIVDWNCSEKFENKKQNDMASYVERLLSCIMAASDDDDGDDNYDGDAD